MRAGKVEMAGDPIDIDTTRAPLLWRPPGDARCVALSSGAAWAAVLGASGSITVLAPTSDAPALRLAAGPAAVAVAISGDGSTVAAVDDARRVHVTTVVAASVWRSVDGLCGLQVTQEVHGAPSTKRTTISPQDLALGPDGRALVISERTVIDSEAYYGGGWIDSGSRTLLSRWSTGTSELHFAAFAEHPITYGPRDAEAIADHPVAAGFSPGGRWLALLLKSGKLLLRVPGAGASVVTPSPQDPGVQAFAFVPGEAAVMFACGRRITTWGLVEGAPRGAFDVHAEVVALAPGPCGSRVACVDVAGNVSIVVASTGERVTTLPRVHPSRVSEASWTDDHLALRCIDGVVLLWT